MLESPDCVALQQDSRLVAFSLDVFHAGSMREASIRGSICILEKNIR